MESLHGLLPRIVPMNRIGDRNAAFRLQRVEVPMVLQPEGRVPESMFMGRELAALNGGTFIHLLRGKLLLSSPEVVLPKMRHAKL